MTTAWLAKSVLASLIAECERMSPLETGGILLGYWGRSGGCPVITQALGPGPQAIHERTAFLPDQAWHEQTIADLYEASGRRLQYLGDWHSHPVGDATLSDLDRQTLQKIAQSRTARSPQPLMLVFWSDPAWYPTVWQGTLQRYLLRAPRLRLRRLRVSPY